MLQKLVKCMRASLFHLNMPNSTSQSRGNGHAPNKALKGKRNEGGLHNRGSTITPQICETVRLQQGCPIKTTRYNLLPSKQCIFKTEIIKLL